MGTKFNWLLIRRLLMIFCFIFLNVYKYEITAQTINKDMITQKTDMEKIIDLSGTWQMKDFTGGIGIQKQVYLPGKTPKNCLPYQVPGTVRTALLAAGEIPDPYFGYDNEKSLWIEQKSGGSSKILPLIKISKENL